MGKKGFRKHRFAHRCLWDDVRTDLIPPRFRQPDEGVHVGTFYLGGKQKCRLCGKTRDKPQPKERKAD